MYYSCQALRKTIKILKNIEHAGYSIMVKYIQRRTLVPIVLAHAWLVNFVVATYSEVSSVLFAYPTNAPSETELLVNVLDSVVV